MASVILPIGQYLGATGDGAHQVRRGAVTERLDAMSFAAWGLGHGPVDPVLAAGVLWTREELVRYAGMAGLLDPAGLVAGLVGRGLLTETATSGPAALAFARTHRAVPIAVGLGNTPDQPVEFTIGFFDRPLLQVDPLRYEVWCWSTVYDTLWQVCQARASAPDGETGTGEPEPDPERLLDHFLTGVHQLASANVLYLDVVDR
jgi:hypothetical protein